MRFRWAEVPRGKEIRVNFKAVTRCSGGEFAGVIDGIAQSRSASVRSCLPKSRWLGTRTQRGYETTRTLALVCGKLWKLRDPR